VVYLEILNQKVAIIGSGNIGSAIAKGLLLSSMIKPNQIILTRRKIKLLTHFEKKGCIVLNDNCEAVKKSKIILIAVPPQQIKKLLNEINSDLELKKHVIISLVSGVTTWHHSIIYYTKKIISKTK
jgi:pyrroline-5-carboxylate reductase